MKENKKMKDKPLTDKITNPPNPIKNIMDNLKEQTDKITNPPNPIKNIMDNLKEQTDKITNRTNEKMFETSYNTPTCFKDELKVILEDISNKCTDIDDHLEDIKSELIRIKELIIVNSTKS